MTCPPVLVLIYRRADLTKDLLRALGQIKPERLYVAADGPRDDYPGDRAQCEATRALVQTIDWPCQIKTLFRTENLGVLNAVSQAMNWFFEQEESGIILEEDCFPHPDFFRYCAELLAYYHDDPRIMQISGVNFQPVSRAGGASYCFSRYNHVWGWATWRRAWKKFRRNFEGLDRFLDDADRSGFWDSRKEGLYWRKIFNQARSGEVQSWAYRWTYTLWAEGGLCLYPETNLVSNLGFGRGATNTTHWNRLEAARPLVPLVRVIHPSSVIRQVVADRWTFKNLYWGTPLVRMGQYLRKLGILLRWIRQEFFSTTKFSLHRSRVESRAILRSFFHIGAAKGEGSGPDGPTRSTDTLPTGNLVSSGIGGPGGDSRERLTLPIS